MAIHELYAYLRVKDAPSAVAYYAKAFGAVEKFRLTEPGGRIGHLELDFGGSTILLSDEFPEFGLVGPRTLGGTPIQIHIHVDDADEVIATAVEAGAEVVRKAEDKFWGERLGVVRDPFGHVWIVGHSIETVSTDQMQRRYTESAKKTKDVGP
jgi:PhnB protein